MNPSKHLLTIALGPVQDFIAAARRTRDLWFGSFLLSEISKATAKAVQNHGGKLIFPNPLNSDDLDPVSPKQTLPENVFKVANIILAELPEGMLPDDIDKTVNAAETAAKNCWKAWADEAGQMAKAIIDQSKQNGGKTLWEEQIEDVLEFYAAWIPLGPNPEFSYASTREQLMRLQAGRKALRDFKPHLGHARIAKSSLDGARESVLKHDRQAILMRTENQHLAQRLRLLPGEELDILGVTKRCATKAAFASVVRVAADPWIRGIVNDNGDGLRVLRDIAEQCGQNLSEYRHENAAQATGSGKWYRDTEFRYDGSMLFPSRLAAMLRTEQNDIKLWDSNEREALERIRDDLLPTLQKPKALGYGEPEPYLAVLVADGDRMGKTLSNIKDMEKHRVFSKQLAQFAGETQTIVSHHHGCLVYAGGDDVLAFLPVDECLKCTRLLHEKFGELLLAFTDDTGHPPTLSAGIAIVHCSEPLEDLLAYGRDAEKNAKRPDRDGVKDSLAVSLHTRGGAPVHVRASWKEKLDERLLKWERMHREKTLSDQAVYGLRQLARDYDNWPRTPLTDVAIEKDIARLFKGKKAGGKALGVAEFNAELTACFSAAYHNPEEVHKDHHPGIMRLANEWIIARKIASVRKQALGKKAANP